MAKAAKPAKPEDAINWFEIPVRDLDRAARFYETILGIKLSRMDMPGGGYAMWPFSADVLGGALVKAKGRVPSKRGTIVYLACGPDMNVALKEVKGAGGTVLEKKFAIGENGFIAFFEDTEGNRVALHSMS